MAKSITLNSQSRLDIQSVMDQMIRELRSLKTVIAPLKQGIKTEHLQYDIGERDLRLIARYSNTEVDHQNSLGTMLMRGF